MQRTTHLSNLPTSERCDFFLSWQSITHFYRPAVRALSRPPYHPTMPTKKCVKSSCVKRQPATSTGGASGGGLVNDLGKLAIPLAFIVANNGLKSATEKKKTPASKTTRTTSARQAAVGGSGDIMSLSTASGGGCRARMASKRGGGVEDEMGLSSMTTGGARKGGMRPPKLLGGAGDASMPSTLILGGRSRPSSAIKKGGSGNANAYGPEGGSYGSLTGGGYSSNSDYVPMSGGSLTSRKHAAVRNEFNKMAMEVKSFLNSRHQ